MKHILAAAGLLLLSMCHVAAQELFVYTEPASNMPAHTIGLRASNWLMNERERGCINAHFIPELMWGINKRLMMHAEGFFSNRSGGFYAEGAGLYAKYRLYSRDTLYRHFRAAAFGRMATNNAVVHQDEIAVNGHNSGVQLGLIATQLLHRQAFSTTWSYEHATDNFGGHEYPPAQSRDAVNLALSAGRLFYPKHYTGYGQVNINGMIEILGQQLLGNKGRFVDIAPALQFIFNSQTRIDIGYRHELWSNMERTAPNGWLIRVEHVLFSMLH